MDRNFMLLADLLSEADNARLLSEGNWGLEKEAQRVTDSGDLALTPHPSVFGDKLENPHITTDFAESQIEMITPPLKSAEQTLAYLEKLQSEVEAGIGNEMLWPMSMPPRLPEEDKIPLSSFNNTEEGREKEAYRSSLAVRYGRKMQMISGIHYNFSFGDNMLNLLYERLGKEKERRTFINEVYFALIRNFLRYRWLLIYLFGASPAADSSYFPVIRNEFGIISRCCPECCSSFEAYDSYSTSLRVSRFGYTNISKGKNEVYYDSLGEYITKLRKLLNDRVLQKESEFYSSIRPKQVPGKGETMLKALEDRGVRYLEVRIFDLNPFERCSIDSGQFMFLQVFMLFCLFEESRRIDKNEMVKINKNHHLAALSGRMPGLKLNDHDGGTVGLKEWGSEIFGRLEQLARMLDRGKPGSGFLFSVENERRKLVDPELLPSSQMLREMGENVESFLDFGIRRAKENSNVNKLSEVKGNVDRL